VLRSHSQGPVIVNRYTISSVVLTSMNFHSWKLQNLNLFKIRPFNH
jgi:hypothetical protein